VPGYVDVVGNDQKVDFAAPAGDKGFFRGRVSLQSASNAPAVDSDSDGLPDAWESLHFGNLSQNAGSLDSNGQTALQNYVAGTDPNNSNDVFRLAVSMNGGSRTVSFFAVQAQGVGYDGRQRHYALEMSTNLGGGWTGVPGYTNLLGNQQTRVYQPPNTAPPAFYRGRVWLEP